MFSELTTCVRVKYDVELAATIINLLIPDLEYYAKANFSKLRPRTLSQGQGQRLTGVRPRPRRLILALRPRPRPRINITAYYVLLITKFTQLPTGNLLSQCFGIRIGQKFWATVCKTVRTMLSDRCLSVCLYCLSVLSCPVCDVGVLWPNGSMAQDETSHAGRRRPWPHCVRWGPSSPSPKGADPQLSAYICCGQMAGWIKMPHGREVGLGPSDIVLDGDPAPLPKKGAEPPQFVAPVYCSQTAGWIKMALGMEVNLSPVHIVLDGDPALLPKKGAQPPPIFGPCLLWPNSWIDRDATLYGGRPRPWPHCGPGHIVYGGVCLFAARSVH